MSKLRLCAGCEKLSFDKPILSTKKANWLKEFDYVKDFLTKTPLTEHKEYKFNIKKEIDVGKKNKKKLVLYWASEPGDSFNIKNAKDAYLNFKNYGVSEVSEDGKIIISIRTPQNYKDNDDNGKDEFFPKHIHYVFSDSKNKEWVIDEIYTQLILGYYNLKLLMDEIKSKKSIIINVLDYNYYAIDHIPGTYSLPHNILKDMKEKDLDNYISDILQLNNFYFIKNKIEKDNFNMKHIPIILYCASIDCKLSEDATDYFLKNGYINISTFPKGMEQYHAKDKNFTSPIYSDSKSLKKILKGGRKKSIRNKII